jgi:hypothetical protein
MEKKLKRRGVSYFRSMSYNERQAEGEHWQRFDYPNSPKSQRLQMAIIDLKNRKNAYFKFVPESSLRKELGC